MYVRVEGFGQPDPVPMPQQPGPAIPPAQMPNPAIPPATPTPSLSIALVRSRLQCSAAQLNAIRGVLGPAVTPETVANAVAQAHNNLWLDLTDPEGAPRSELLKATPTPRTEALFTNAFGIGPTKLPWRGARRNLGWIVATRLGGARKTMFSSSIRISCWGYPWPGGGPDLPNGYMVKALPRRERVGLGALFWQAFGAGDRTSMAAAILTAGLVIRYGVSYRLLAPPLRNLHCYIKYALSMLNFPLPQWVSDKCPQVV